MFEAIIQADRLQAFVDSLTCLVDEAKIHVDHDDEVGFHARAVDPANVAMVQSDLAVEAFEAFDSGAGTIALNVDRFDDVIDFADAGDLVELTWNEQTRRLDVVIDTDAGRFQYDLALIDPGSIRSEPDIPDIGENLTERFIISGSQFDTAVSATTLGSDMDHVEMATEPSDVTARVHFRAEGDTDTSSVTFDTTDCVHLDAPDGRTSLFSADYLHDMLDPIPGAAEVEFHLGDEFPVQWTYTAGEGVEVLNLLSPRIKSE